MKRKFDGQTFMSHPSKKHGTHKSKKAADAHARRIREGGHKARVTKEKGRHRVWQGPYKK